jgi:hypothetical protein
MIVLARLAWLLALSPAPAAVVVDNPNRVEICSLQSGDCRSVAAAALDTSASMVTAPTRAGQLAFVDPDSGALTVPTQEQLADLASELEIHEGVRSLAAPARLVTAADGTVVAAPRGGFLVELRAEVGKVPGTSPDSTSPDSTSAGSTSSAHAAKDAQTAGDLQ